MEIRIHTSIADIEADRWQRWFGDDYPFLRWDFLRGLETTGCVGGQSGWQPCHLVVTEDGTDLHPGAVIGVAPGFLKGHSYGEYVFDWAWADAWRRHGLDYYPKLIAAAPFTPATGPRLYLNPDFDDALARTVAAITQFCSERGISGWHCLFPEASLSAALSDLGLVQRHTTQFHWFNRDYGSFDDFLSTFASRKRKNLRKERARIGEQNLSLETRVGNQISDADWAFFHHCYQITYAKRSGHGGYLTQEFFTELCPALGNCPVMVIARHQDKPVAAALYFQSKECLYGRYWGCLREYDGLHFEACYYRGIEFCIEHGIARFDPGAQGEHKIQRGFEPTLTYSNHWIGESGFRDAIARFCQEDRAQTLAYQEDAATLLPFKQA